MIRYAVLFIVFGLILIVATWLQNLPEPMCISGSCPTTIDMSPTVVVPPVTVEQDSSISGVLESVGKYITSNGDCDIFIHEDGQYASSKYHIGGNDAQPETIINVRSYDSIWAMIGHRVNITYRMIDGRKWVIELKEL